MSNLPDGWINELAELRQMIALDGEVWSPETMRTNDGIVRAGNSTIADTHGHEARADFIAFTFNRLPAMIELARRLAVYMEGFDPFFSYDKATLAEAQRAGLISRRETPQQNDVKAL